MGIFQSGNQRCGSLIQRKVSVDIKAGAVFLKEGIVQHSIVLHNISTIVRQNCQIGSVRVFQKLQNSLQILVMEHNFLSGKTNLLFGQGRKIQLGIQKNQKLRRVVETSFFCGAMEIPVGKKDRFCQDGLIRISNEFSVDLHISQGGRETFRAVDRAIYHNFQIGGKGRGRIRRDGELSVHDKDRGSGGQSTCFNLIGTVMSGKGRRFLLLPVNDGGRVYVDGIAPEKQPTPGVAQKDAGIDVDRGIG